MANSGAGVCIEKTEITTKDDHLVVRPRDGRMFADYFEVESCTVGKRSWNPDGRANNNVECA